MSLSSTCRSQHAKEDTATKRWLFVGLCTAVGAHLSLLPLLTLNLPGSTTETANRISVVVTGPADLQGEVNKKIVPPKQVLNFADKAEPSLAPQPPGSEPLGAQPTEPLKSVEDTPVKAEAARVKAPAASESNSPTQDTETSKIAHSINQSSLTESQPDSAETEQTETPTVPNTQNNSSRNNSPSAPSAALGRDRPDSSDRSGSSATAPETVNPSPNSETLTTGASRLGPAMSVSRSNPLSCRRCGQPQYPEAALASGIGGKLVISLNYDENGNALGAVLQQSSGNAAIDQAALDAARTYEFNTGGKSGQILLDFEFGIGNSRRSSSSEAARSPNRSPGTHKPERHTPEPNGDSASSQPTEPQSIETADTPPAASITEPANSAETSPEVKPSTGTVDISESSAPETVAPPESEPVKPASTSASELSNTAPATLSTEASSAPAPIPPAPLEPTPSKNNTR